MASRNVLITGAGSGLGRALAQRHARAGDVIAVADLVPERAAETVELLGGAPHFALTVDVGSDDSVAAMAAALQQRWDRLDVLYNNAGVASGGGLLEADMAEWQWMLNINLLGVVRVTRALLPMMLARKSGHILNTASFAGLAGAPNMMSYGVAKAGVVAFSEQLRAELYRPGLRVSVICPAFFQTRLLENFRGQNEKMKKVADRLMKTASVSADDVADHIVRAAERGDFMILPTPGEASRWRIKRWFPTLYFKQLMKLVEQRSQIAKQV